MHFGTHPFNDAQRHPARKNMTLTRERHPNIVELGRTRGVGSAMPGYRMVSEILTPTSWD